MHQMARQYVELGQTVTFIVAGQHDDVTESDLGRTITIAAPILPGSGGYRFILNVKAVIDALTSENPDCIEVSDRTTLQSIGTWAKRHNIGCLMWAHERVDGVLTAWGPRHITPSKAIADWHNRKSARIFSKIICTTRYAQEEFVRLGIQTHLVPLGVDHQFFHPERSNAGLRDLLVHHDEHLFVMASRLSPEKNPLIALEAMRHLRSRGVKARLVVAGTGPLEARMRRLAWGLPIDFLGFVSDRHELATLLATADIVFAPGPIETFGLSALEALASGTNVIASNTSALREIVTPGAGLTVAPTAVAFADAAERVLAEPEEQRVRAARERALSFSWRHSAEQVLSIHQGAA